MGGIEGAAEEADFPHARAIAWRRRSANALDDSTVLGQMARGQGSNMVEGIEGVGDAVTGGVIARAVEPTAGESPAAEEHPETCSNCGAGLGGRVCPYMRRSGQFPRTRNP